MKGEIMRRIIEAEFQTLEDRNWFIKEYKMKYYTLFSRNGKYYMAFTLPKN